MDHVAIMRKSWGMVPKLLSGGKTVESRWYMTRRPPWDRISSGDTVYFKDSGRPVTAMAEVEKVVQFDGLTPEKVREILDVHAKADGISGEDVHKYFGMFKDRRYCILVFLRNIHPIKPFDIDKRGFGTMAPWLVVDKIRSIILH